MSQLLQPLYFSVFPTICNNALTFGTLISLTEIRLQRNYPRTTFMWRFSLPIMHNQNEFFIMKSEVPLCQSKLERGSCIAITNTSLQLWLMLKPYHSSRSSGSLSKSESIMNGIIGRENRLMDAVGATNIIPCVALDLMFPSWNR